MAIQASSEAIRDMAKSMRGTVSDIEHISTGIKSGFSNLGSWDDEKSEEFKAIMLRIAELVEQPKDTLEDAAPRLEKLARILDEYSGVKLG